VKFTGFGLHNKKMVKLSPLDNEDHWDRVRRNSRRHEHPLSLLEGFGRAVCTDNTPQIIHPFGGTATRESHLPYLDGLQGGSTTEVLVSLETGSRKPPWIGPGFSP
jgi:hypothetical protein